MKKYVVKRDEVKIGSLTKIVVPKIMSIAINDNGEILNVDSLNILETLGINVKGGVVYRGMIYRVDENNLAQDLIYTTPTNHVIDGIEPSIALSEEPMLLMRNAELGELLKYLKFGEDLTQNDLNKIYRMFLKHRIWLSTHPELFGFFKKDGHIYHDESKAIFPEELFDSLYSAALAGGNPDKNEVGFESIRRIR